MKPSSPGWEDDPTALRGAQRVFSLQLSICIVIGFTLFMLFCIFRSRWPHMYALRTLRDGTSIKPLPPGWFGWIRAVYRVSDEELLRVLGLDAYVFVAFFQMAIKIFAVISVIAVVVMLPARYWAQRDDGVDWMVVKNQVHPRGDKSITQNDAEWFFYLYALATYVFSLIVFQFLNDFTKKILKVRQKYLASQNSITDRTILLSGIPTKLLIKNDPNVLKEFVESMGIGKVLDVRFIYDWSILNELFVERRQTMTKLEEMYALVHGLNVNLYNTSSPAVGPMNMSDSTSAPPHINLKVADLRKKLLEYNQKIRQVQSKFDFLAGIMTDKLVRQINSAFITMDSVALAQMAAQTVLDPRVNKLIVHLAPAPKDIKWDSFKLNSRSKLMKSYTITFVIGLSFLILAFPISSISTLINLKTITKFWPALGAIIKESKWLTMIITGILPPFLFSMFNFLLPYFYKWLTYYQGYLSNSDIELATLLKNFFYIFFNLFLVFTVTGTVLNFFGLIGDTTKIAYQLATLLKELSLFYINLILLQGVAMFPVRLLQISDFLIFNLVGRVFFLRKFILKTPRDYRFYYYTPQIFDFGLQLPQHLLIFIIVLIYSVVSTKIITCGLVYFILGHLVYKYQLIYSFVHPPHSTGKVWPMIFRRLILGLIIFQIFMCGTLALNDEYILSVICIPLIFISLIMCWNFENYYLPLHKFIALRAIQNPFDDFDKEFIDEDVHTFRRSASSSQEDLNNTSIGSINESSRLIDELMLSYHDLGSLSDIRTLKRRKSTIDEEREEFTNYTYPYLKDPLNGPWVGFEGNFVSMLYYPEEGNNTNNQNKNNTHYNSTTSDENNNNIIINNNEDSNNNHNNTIDSVEEIGIDIIVNERIDVVHSNDHEKIIKKRLTVSEWE